jgi:hypothetical protein
MLPITAKRLLAFGRHFSQIELDSIGLRPILARFPHLSTAPDFSPQHSLDIQTVELSGPGRRRHVDPGPLFSTALGNMILPLLKGDAMKRIVTGIGAIAVFTALAAGQTYEGYVDVLTCIVKPDKRSDFDTVVKKMAAANRRYKGEPSRIRRSRHRDIQQR